jgi:hypothetical protein
MNKRELRNQQKGSLKRLKKSAPEVKSASEDKVPLKWWRHQKQVHQKLKITRSWSSSEDARLKASSAVQWI